MWAQVQHILRQAATQIADHVADFLPGLVVAVLLVAATVIAAMVVRGLVTRALKGLDFDRRADDWGMGVLVGWPPSPSPSESAGRVAYWALIVLGLLVSLTALNASIPSQLALAVFQYLPHVLAALVILVVGGIAARFLARSTLIGAVNMQIQSARLLSLLVKWLVLLVTFAMALDHLGIGRTVLRLAFAISFGGVVLAAALAIGLGARDAVARAIEQQSRPPAPRDDTVNHV